VPAHRSIAIVVIAACVVAWPLRAAAATMREAHVAIQFVAGACDVTARFAVDTADPVWVDHRLLLGDASVAPEFSVTGALASPARIIGRTAQLRVSLVGSGRNEYQVRYRFPVYDAQTDRCSLVVPDVPSDGQTRAVRLTVSLPPGTQRLPASFPALTWESGTGRLSLGHLPSFVRVPHAQPGAALRWRDHFDVARFVDMAAIVAIGAASLAWIVLRRAGA
jgi:hypothetical protein